MAQLEHLNITVPNAEETAALFVDVFGWRIRWEGDAMGGGRSVHVGGDDTYIAFYTPNAALRDAEVTYQRSGALNHVGLVVDDLDDVEAAFRARGLEPHSHADYTPGRRFYVNDPNGLEIEVVQY